MCSIQQSQSQPQSRSIINEYHEFNLIKTIGHGGFGHVYWVQKKNGKDRNELYALKEVVTHTIDSSDDDKTMATCLENVHNERKVLELVRDCHFCVQLMYAFKIDNNYYLVLEYYPRGDLSEYLNKHKQLDSNTARLCVAEILLGIEFLHSKKIIYRDLKPENILIDNLGHLAITDFGLAQYLDENDFMVGCSGTMDYMAPEAIRIPAEGYRHAVDFWSIGCVLYEMLTGTVPFVADIDFANDPHEQHFLLLHILYFEPSYDYYCFREDLIAKHFLKMLLEKSPTKRLGTGPNGINDIKSHEYFGGINWQYVYHKHYDVLGTECDNINVPLIYYERKLFRKKFIKNGYDYVSEHLLNEFQQGEATSKIQNILGPSEQSFDALYDQRRERISPLYGKQYDCHMILPRSNVKAFMKRFLSMPADASLDTNDDNNRLL